MKNILECSSAGDKRFSAYYAKVNIFGFNSSIENHYQNCKIFYDYEANPKGKYPDFIKINGVDLSPEYLTSYYKLLWCIYLDKNPKLVEYAKQFDDYNDKFKGKSVNCQADVIRQYIKEGRESILNDIKDLLPIIGITIF